ncbi:hypothetical protein BH11MYX3_BH11MYX3_19040 [soil metagenome]
MTTATPYATSTQIISDRVRWANACLFDLVNKGRAAGWLEGAPIAANEPAHEIRAAIGDRIAVTARDVGVAPMEWLGARLGLAAPELELLWLLVCIELEPGVARLAQVFGAPGCPDLSVQIAQQLLVIDAAGLETLAGLGLIELTTDPQLPQHRRAIRIHDRVLEIARGELRLAAELEGMAALHGRAIGSCSAELARAITAQPPPALFAIGPEGAGRTTLLAHAAGEHGLGTLRITTAALARDVAKLERQLRALIREACLFEVVPLFIDLDAEAGHPASAAIERAVKAFHGPVLVTARETISWRGRPVVTQVVERPDRAGREQIWRQRLTGTSAAVIDAAATGYALRPGSIVAAATNALASTGGDPTAVTIQAIHAGVRARMGDELGTLATRIDWRQTWDDLVLPVDQFEQIIELVARVRHRSTVLETWGFGAKIGKGHGLTALFSGPPGTGKTMVAGLIASELGLDLYQVDLSKVVSKYIGETEKQLAALFDAAETGHAILLFDEADSLFGKRTEVKSSNDRYANLEVNYLLQRLETFTGIALLTTNHETAIDEAFRRRLALHVRFPLPEEEQREQLWRAMLPPTAPVNKDLDLGRLARELEMSGGYIKNAVLRAAYLAAEAGTAISMQHLQKSARSEYEALGKIAHHRE